MSSVIQPIDRDALREQFQTAQPFPSFSIDGFLDPEFAMSVAKTYPTYACARTMGQEFSAVNERLKVQITDSAKFPAPVKTLSDALASPEFLADLEYITGIPNLLADPELAGGGMHLSGPGGRLDVHVDFNYLADRALHRRLNILVYLNPQWEDGWGGYVELWDRSVSHCVQAFKPVFNRCVVFQTSQISFHGVTPVTCPVHELRRSFAAYYYTKEAPEGWDGTEHSTIFRARPNEKLRGSILMPAEAAKRAAVETVQRGKRWLKRAIQRKSD